MHELLVAYCFAAAECAKRRDLTEALYLSFFKHGRVTIAGKHPAIDGKL